MLQDQAPALGLPSPANLPHMDKGKGRKYRAHIEHLASVFEVSLTWTKGGWHKAMSYPDLGEAIVPRITSAADYLVALHELGHVIDPEARKHGRYDEDLHHSLLCEGAAWAWAAMQALPVPRKAWLRAATALTTYLILPAAYEDTPNPPP